VSDRKKGKNFYYSHLEKLKENNIVNREFENTISKLSLEDLITIKLEITAKSLNGKFYGLPIFNSIDKIIKYAIINFALSAGQSYAQAADILNMDKSNLRKLIKKYKFIEDNSHDYNKSG
tara:strand:- start:794 stop:1153 length:360 start_codon:yes stop_codon:yes gene_type:complete